jgi:hypothetical protein
MEPSMEAKEAASIAKQHIAELWKDEGANHIGLEEIEFDGTTGTWRITVGFSRPWHDLNEPPFASLAALALDPKRIRDMKVVELSDTDRHVLSVKNRE